MTPKKSSTAKRAKSGKSGKSGKKATAKSATAKSATAKSATAKSATAKSATAKSVTAKKTVKKAPWTPPPSLPGAPEALAAVRKLCLALPDVSERVSHGAPSFFIKGKHCFVNFVDNHHHDGRLAICCAAPAGIQHMLVEDRPDVFYVPPYVGVMGWLGVQLDKGLAHDELARIVDSAYATVVEKHSAKRKR